MRTAHFLAVMATLSVAAGFSGVHSRSGLRPVALQRRVSPMAVRMAVPEPAVAADEGLVAPAPTRRSRASKATKVAFGLAAAFATSLPAVAAKAVAAEEHLHIGQKVAKFFQASGLPDEAIVFIISAMPVVELRGAIPVGVWLDLPIAKVLPLCVAGNMLPIPIILFALRSKLVQKIMKPILDRAQHKAEESFADPKTRAVLLAAFVGVPLPGTGAWTGAMGAFLLGMPFGTAMASIFAGVVTAGIIMSTLTAGGKWGAIITGSFLLGALLLQLRGGGGEAKK